MCGRSGVFVNETPETIARIVIDAGLDVAQLHGIFGGARRPDLARCQAVDPCRCLTADCERGSGADRTPPMESSGGTGKHVGLVAGARVSHRRSSSPAASTPTTFGLAIEQAQPWGVDACSRIEKSPGLKDHEKMRKFVKAALESVMSRHSPMPAATSVRTAAAMCPKS